MDSDQRGNIDSPPANLAPEGDIEAALLLAELRVTELEIQAEVARRDIAIGLHPEWLKTRAAIELHRQRYEAYVKALAEMFWRNMG